MSGDMGKLSDVAKVQSGFAFNSRDWRGDGVPVIKIQNVRAGRVKLEGCSYVSDEVAVTASRYRLYRGDVLVTMSGEIGSVGVVRTDEHLLLNQRVGRIVLLDPDAAEIRYIAYALQDPCIKSMMEAIAYGAAQPNISPTLIGSLPLWLPPRATQTAIANVLEAFDDLIENNRRRIEVLEEMARSIYREWFVKFRYPGHGDVPMVESALGPIPEGWVVRAVGEVSAVVVRGISPKYAKDGEWIVLNQKCIRNGRVSLAPSRRQERSVSEAKRIRSGDVLINSTGVGTLGRVAMYRGLSEGVTVDSHVTICRPVQGSLNPWYAMSLLAKQSDIERLGAGATGQTELRKSDVEALELVRPAAPVVEAFNAVISPLLEQIDFLLASSETTSALRDLLLPKLVTGQIDVSTLDLDALIAAERAGEGAVA